MESCGIATHAVHALVAMCVATTIALVIYFFHNPNWSKEGAFEVMYEAILSGFLEGGIVSFIVCMWVH